MDVPRLLGYMAALLSTHCRGEGGSRESGAGGKGGLW